MEPANHDSGVSSVAPGDHEWVKSQKTDTQEYDTHYYTLSCCFMYELPVAQLGRPCIYIYIYI